MDGEAGMILDRIRKNLVRNRDTILGGGVNCIPWPFTRFREEVPGTRKGFYYIVSGATKSSKTQITNYIFILNSVFYYIGNPGKVKPTIHMFPLEETRDDIFLRIYSFVLYRISDGKWRLSPEELESIDERKPLPMEVLDIMGSKTFVEVIRVFEECLVFHEERHATGIYMAVKTYLEEHGHWTYVDKEVTYRDGASGKPVTKMVHKRDVYVPDNPNEYVMFIVDHVGLLRCETAGGKTQTLKEAIEALSEYCVLLRNEYGAIPVVVQQQNSETTNLSAYRADKIRPTKDGLKDSKRPGEDCTMLIGITNPFAFGKNESQGYDIRTLKDRYRILEVVLARKGRANGLCPLYFDGAINLYRELPRPSSAEMREIYESLRNREREASPGTLFMMLSFVKKKFGMLRGRYKSGIFAFLPGKERKRK